ncbi:hypothetical protein [Microcystis aeruginosa]|uniref:hypothetical protein n=1 Tax=Microcystis aeruginosa TaxID=1126 RepID=UPI0002ABA032|nr:hypothetical protein [Microcystis aeruginosa]ELS44709.1 uma4 domain protein [Microcystis aeruginosa FACHB-905 = DIANCHI905]
MILDKFLNLKGTSIQGYLHLENIGIVCQIESKNQKAMTGANAIRPYNHIIAPMVGAHRGLVLRN